MKPKHESKPAVRPLALRKETVARLTTATLSNVRGGTEYVVSIRWQPGYPPCRLK